MKARRGCAIQSLASNPRKSWTPPKGLPVKHLDFIRRYAPADPVAKRKFQAELADIVEAAREDARRHARREEHGHLAAMIRKIGNDDPAKAADMMELLLPRR